MIHPTLSLLVPCHPSLVSKDMEPKAVNVFRNGANALLLLVTDLSCVVGTNLSAFLVRQGSELIHFHCVFNTHPKKITQRKGDS